MSITKAGYLGPDQATFGYLAAKKAFNGDREVELAPYPSHNDIIMAVGRQEVSHGIAAIENVIQGVVSETVRSVEDAAGQYGLAICGEVIVPIGLYFLGVDPGVAPKKILSHPSPVVQCRRFLAILQQQGVTVEVRSSTGEAAREASENPEIAVIASAHAAELYGLKRLRPDSVADINGNMTRFWVLGKGYAEHTGNDKSTFLVNLEQARVGALADALGYFRDAGVNLCLVYLNPIPGRPWEYTFLFEVRGHISDPEMARIWEALSQSGLCLNRPRCLGSYPAASAP